MSVLQNSTYIGINLQNILYGVDLVLYFRTMHILLSGKRQRTKSNMFYAVFSTVMVLLASIIVATQTMFGEEMWVVNTNYPGGDDEYFAVYSSFWYMTLGSTAMVLLQLMTDGLMIFRCWVIFGGYRMVIVPMILWAGSLVLGALTTWATNVPGSAFGSHSEEIMLAYYSVSVVMTAMLTLMICYRMARHGRRVREHLGDKYASVYFTLMSIIVESVLPYTLTGVACVVTSAMNSDTATAFMWTYAMMMCVSPQMVILRIASGRSWDEDADTMVPSTVKFSPGMSCEEDVVVKMT